MPIHNADIARIFEEIADLLEIQSANPFRIRAYRNAARTVGEFGRDIGALLAADEDLTRLPGIGDDLAGKIREIVETGQCALLDRLRKELPPAITELLHIPGLGPKRVRALWHDLDVQTIEQLYRAARDGRIRSLAGFGEKTELKILQSVEAHLGTTRRFKLATAAQYADSLVAYLKGVSGVRQAEVAGSFRRMRETVGDLDILVTAQAKSPVMERFASYDEVKEVLSGGPTRASVILRSGLQVDLRVVDEASYGSALVYFTGSKAHKYIAITEHSRRLTVARGLDPQRLLKQCDEIDRLSGELKGITILKGIEVDILDDGTLDLPDSVLAKLDIVVGAVHSKFDLPRAKQTERILRAMDSQYFTILAHPTGRVIEQREPYDADMLRIIRHARQRGCFLELNAHPERLDLLDTWCLTAKEEGVPVAINSDAHGTQDFQNLRFGVGQARRGWLEAKDVLNTRPLKELRKLLPKHRP